MTPTYKQMRNANGFGSPSRGGSLGVNAAFLQEVKDDEHVVPDLIRNVASSLCGRSLDVPQSRVVLTVLRRLHSQLKYRFQLEEVLGYMDDVVSVAPRLSNRAERLRGEHVTLLEQLQQFIESAHDRLLNACDLTPCHSLAELRAQFASFQEQYDAHEAGEDDLIIESLYLDIGGCE